VIPFTVALMYHLRQIGDPSVFSPSGTEVAFVVKRPLEGERNFAQSFLEDDDVADVYVSDLANGRITKISNGDVDGSGFWDPQWSPDGKRIAMLSTRGGNVYLWVWDAGVGLRRVTSRAVAGFNTQPFAWISNDRIICEVLPAGKQPLSMSVETQTPQIASRAWPIDWRGHQATVNVLESGVSPNIPARPQSELLLLNVSGAREIGQVIAHAAQFGAVTLSHDRRLAAVYSKVGFLEPHAGRKLPSNFDNGIYALSVYDTRTGARVARFDRRAVGAGPLGWSWDDTKLAALAEPATTAYKSHLQIYRCILATSDCAPILPAQLNVDSGPNGTKTAPLWAADGHVLVYAASASAGAAAPKDRSDWYSIASNGSVANATASLASSPASLVTIAGEHRFVGVAGGNLVSVFADGQPPRTIAVLGVTHVTSIAWPTTGAISVRELVVTSGEVDRDFFALDGITERIVRLGHVPADAALNAFDPQTFSAVFAESARDGSFLRYTRAGSPQRILYAANTWLSSVAAGHCIHFSYTALDSQKLTGWLVLPANYAAPRRYPAVVWVYAGSVMSPNKVPTLAHLNFVIALNLQLLAARGYAVIIPSMPLPPFGHPTDPYQKLTNGVLPAVDKAVQLGYVDGDRVAVMGQSYGGFSTYGLITQTNRFKAAIALAGISDWASLYGTFDERQAYGDNANEDIFAEQLLEDGQANLGDPPWINPQRYAANSPITYVDRVHTPLLIIQGDLDYVAIQQGEEFFTALYRQGKRAEFARYWGEEHVFRSEANVADSWRRIINWLDQFLR
jgi:dipeptidyl aminopeptidase/acylaminoacyl peptidase